MRSMPVWYSEDLLNVGGGFQRGIMDVGLLILPEGWVPVDFTMYKLIASTFVDRLSSGGFGMGSSSVSLNYRWLDLPWRLISGR